MTTSNEQFYAEVCKLTSTIVLSQVVEYLNENEYQDPDGNMVTVKELEDALNIVVKRGGRIPPPTTPKKRSPVGSNNDEGCQYIFTSGSKMGQKCGTKKYDDLFCKTCSGKVAATKQRENLENGLEQFTPKEPKGAKGTTRTPRGKAAGAKAGAVKRAGARKEPSLNLKVLGSGLSCHEKHGVRYAIRLVKSVQTCIGTLDEDDNIVELLDEEIEYCKSVKLPYVSEQPEPEKKLPVPGRKRFQPRKLKEEESEAPAPVGRRRGFKAKAIEPEEEEVEAPAPKSEPRRRRFQPKPVEPEEEEEEELEEEEEEVVEEEEEEAPTPRRQSRVRGVHPPSKEVEDHADEVDEEEDELEEDDNL